MTKSDEEADLIVLSAALRSINLWPEDERHQVNKN
jgi:hypothetical protein